MKKKGEFVNCSNVRLFLYVDCGTLKEILVFRAFILCIYNSVLKRYSLSPYSWIEISFNSKFENQCLEN